MTVKEIIDAVSDEYGVPVAVIRGRNRIRDVAEAREMAMHLLSRGAGMTKVAIGRALGRTYSTVVSGIKRVEGLIEVDRAVAERHRRILDRLGLEDIKKYQLTI